MAKETKFITIPRGEYDFLKNKADIYKGIVGLLITSIKAKDEIERAYSYNEVEKGFYCEDSTDTVKQILSVIKVFDPTAYAVITGHGLTLNDMLQNLADMLSDEEVEDDEDDEEVEDDEDDEVEAEA